MFFCEWNGWLLKEPETAWVHTSYHKLFVMVLQDLCIQVRIDGNDFILPSVDVLQHKKQTMTHFMKVLGRNQRAQNLRE